jgi:hypothetical protein
MKKLILFLLLCLTGILSAGSTQVAIFVTGKDAYLKVVDSGTAGVIKSATKWDHKTSTKVFQCLYFIVSTKSQKEVKKINFKVEAEKGEMIFSIGRKRADKLLWTSIKVDGKEQIKDPKKGELIGLKQFKIEKIDKKKTITIEATLRAPTKKELQGDKSAAKKAKKSKKSKK